MGLERQRQEDLVDPVVGENARDGLAPPEHLLALDALAHREPVVQVADHADAELGVAAEPPDDLLAELPRADDERAADEAPVAPERADHVADRQPDAEDRDDVERPEDHA